MTAKDRASDAMQMENQRLQARLAELETRLQESEETLRAIQAGEVDALIVGSGDGERVFTLQGADYTYRLLIEHMYEGAATLSPDGSILYANQRLADLLHEPLQRVIGSSVADWIAADDQSTLQSLLQQAIGGTGRREVRLRLEAGAELAVSLSISSITIADETHLFVVVTDLTTQKEHERSIVALTQQLERRVQQRTEELQIINRDLRTEVAERQQAEAALIRSELRLRQALGAAFAGVWEWDVRSDQITWSAENYELFGIEPGSMVTFEDWKRSVHAEDLPAAMAVLNDTLERRRDEYRVEFRVSHTQRWILGLGRAEFGPDGQAVRMSGINIDITERKREEQELHAAKLSAERAREAAEAASRAKDQFLAVLSHELRTPLNPALMAATILEKSPQLPPDLREDVSVIRRNVELEARLIDDMLDLTRIGRGKLSLHRQVIDARAVLRYAVETCRPDAMEKELELDLFVPDQPILVEADPARLQQIFWNLIKNSVKFTPDHGRITVTASFTDNGGLHVEVSDTGRGIEKEVLDRIFGAFEQGGSSISRRYGGLGLGLAICQGLVAMHQGTISAFSEGAGKGSTFTVELPPAKVDPNRPEQGAPLSDQSRVQHPAACRILLVEDHESTARITTRLLRSLGHEVVTTDCVADALEKAKEAQFDLLISDLGLPDGSGHELLRKIRAFRPMAAIALSGYGMDHDLQQSIDAGFSEHLVKPINASQLEQTIARVTGGCRMGSSES